METECRKPEGSNAGVLRACLGCLATETNLHYLDERGFAQICEITGVSVNFSDGYPQFACTICLALLQKFCRFRTQCLTAIRMLQQIQLTENNISIEAVKNIERDHIRHNLNITDIFYINITNNNDEDLHTTNKINDNYENSENNFNEEMRTYKTENDDYYSYNDIENGMTTNKTENVEFNYKNDSNNGIGKRILWEQLSMVKQEDDNQFDGIEPSKVVNVLIEVDPEFASIKLKDDGPTRIRGIKDTKKAESKKKAIKRKVAGVVKKTKEAKKRIRKKEEEPLEVITDENLKKIFDEINADTNMSAKSKSRAITNIKIQMKTAEEFTNAYNLKVKFLSKEEQKMEIEQKRNSEKYKTARYKCEICCKVFDSADTYRNHCIAHDPKSGDFECEICRYRFRTRLKYCKHYHTLHIKRISCKECGVSCRQWSDAKRHYLWHKGEHSVIECEQCPMKFTVRKKYLNHMRNQHGGGTGGPQCLLCDRGFINQLGLKVHMDMAHKNKVTCSTCSSVFDSADTLAAHTAAPETCCQGISACPKCGKNFSSDSAMREHYDAEHKKRSLCCKTCQRTFTDFGKYTLHKEDHKKTVEKKQSVSRNNSHKEDRKKRTVSQKPRNTNQNGRFICEVCGVVKNFLIGLQVHMRTHRNERPFECDVCQKSFRQLAALRIHMTIHTGERRYKCPECPKSFRQSAHRVAHMVTHTKERAFLCTMCPKRYTAANTLRDHVNTTHLGMPARKRLRK